MAGSGPVGSGGGGWGRPGLLYPGSVPRLVAAASRDLAARCPSAGGCGCVGAPSLSEGRHESGGRGKGRAVPGPPWCLTSLPVCAGPPGWPCVARRPWSPGAVGDSG